MALSEQEEFELLSLEKERAMNAKAQPSQADVRRSEPRETSVERFDRKAKESLDAVGSNIRGVAEAGATVLTGLTGGLVGRLGGTLGGIAGSVASGKYGTQEGAAMAAQTAEEGATRFTFEPRSEEGKDALEKLHRLFETSKLAGLGPAESIALGRSLPAASDIPRGARQAANKVGDVTARALAKDIPDEPLPSTMVGVGSAMTDAAEQRRQIAGSLPVPINLTKGQAERTFAQQQFEKEVAKNPTVGGPIRQRIEEQNRNILQNFDTWIDQTGAEAGSIRSTGEAVTKALAAKADKAKSEIRFAYEVARKTGDMNERIPVSELQSYVKNHAAEAINAPVITSVGMKLENVAKGGTIAINDLEEVRKMVGALSGKDATNAHFGKEIKSVIDLMTEGKGGENYKKARALRSRYAIEFEDRAVIDKLLSFKSGTRDRAVAYEDVFRHSILSGSLDDVRTVRKVLQTGGAQGEQAWRELQGATLKHIRDEITRNVATDSQGQRVLSPARLNQLVTELDKDGKLDFIFGKKGAQQIRDVNGIAIDAFTAPPGAVNHSNTASILLGVLDKVSSGLTGIPFAGSVANFAVKEVRDAGLRKQVKEALK